jgi:hypothetical protein
VAIGGQTDGPTLGSAIVVSALNLLSAAPGILFAPGAVKIVAAAAVLVSAVILVLVVSPVSRRALIASGAPRAGA